MRFGADAGLSFPGELQVSVYCAVDYRFLAAVAYDARQLVPGICVYSCLLYTSPFSEGSAGVLLSGSITVSSLLDAHELLASILLAVPPDEAAAFSVLPHAESPVNSRITASKKIPYKTSKTQRRTA